MHQGWGGVRQIMPIVRCQGHLLAPSNFFAPVMGKYQSILGFKSRFEHLMFYLRYNDSIWNTSIRFAIWLENFAILFEE